MRTHKKGYRDSQKVQDRSLQCGFWPRKLPNSDLNFAVDLWVDIFLFFPRKKARKNPPKNPPQNSPGNSVGKIPLGFLQKPFLNKNSRPDYHLWLGPTSCFSDPGSSPMGTSDKVLISNHEHEPLCDQLRSLNAKKLLLPSDLCCSIVLGLWQNRSGKEPRSTRERHRLPFEGFHIAWSK